MLASISSSVAVSGTLSKQVPLASSVNVVATTKIVIPDGSVSLRSSVKFSGSAVGTISVIRKRDINDVLPAHLVEQQFPAFIREDYPKMVEFTRAYYDYMAQTENGRIKNLRDIDETSGDYLNYMMNEYLYNASKPNFQQDFAAEDFIRYSRQFYAAKGTEESIRFIFRAQAAQEIEIDYPSEQIFKPSTAKWYQEQSVKIVMTENSIPATYFVGNYLTFKNSKGKEQTVQVSNVIDLTDKVSVYDLSTIFEVFFTTELFIDIAIGDELNGTNFQSTIIPSLSGIDIVEPGNNFRVGQIAELDGVTGSGAVAVITKVLEGGQIRNLKLIKFGKDYTTNFYLGIQPDGVFTDIGASFTVPNVSIDGAIPTSTKAISDITEGFIENQSLLRSDYVLNDSGTGTPKVLDTFPFYTYPGYDGVYVSQLSNRQVFFLEENYSALLLCKIGAICTYPGKYLDQTGMPSNASVLQDNNYYQDFSYVIRSNVDIDNYRDTITTLAHPAGFKMFGELSIDNEFYSDTTSEGTGVYVSFSNGSGPEIQSFIEMAGVINARITVTPNLGASTLKALAASISTNVIVTPKATAGLASNRLVSVTVVAALSVT